MALEARPAGTRRERETLLLWVRPMRIGEADYAYVFNAANPSFDAGLLAVREAGAIGRAAASLARSCGWSGAWEVREEATGRAVRRRGLVAG